MADREARQAAADQAHSPRPFGDPRLIERTIWRGGVGLPSSYLRTIPRGLLPQEVREEI